VEDEISRYANAAEKSFQHSQSFFALPMQPQEVDTG
jgi:hypothetical protein